METGQHFSLWFDHAKKRLTEAMQKGFEVFETEVDILQDAVSEVWGLDKSDWRPVAEWLWAEHEDWMQRLQLADEMEG